MRDEAKACELLNKALVEFYGALKEERDVDYDELYRCFVGAWISLGLDPEHERVKALGDSVFRMRQIKTNKRKKGNVNYETRRNIRRYKLR